MSISVRMGWMRMMDGCRSLGRRRMFLVDSVIVMALIFPVPSWSSDLGRLICIQLSRFVLVDHISNALMTPIPAVPHIFLYESRTNPTSRDITTPLLLSNSTFPRRITDEALIEKLFNPTISAWFGDKGDGVHTGKPSDPRMAVVEVKIDEIRHFHQVKTTIGTLVDVVTSAVSGSTATPGQIRTITGEEISSAWSKGELKEP